MKIFLKTYKHRLVAGIQTLWASSTAYLAYLSANPDVRFLLPHKYFVPLALGSAVLGGVHFFLGKATPPPAA